jgi:hypothetical protein
MPRALHYVEQRLNVYSKEFLITKRIYTEPQLKREQPTAGTLLEKAKQAGFRGPEYNAAKRVVGRGDPVLHRSIHEKRILHSKEDGV